MDNNEEHKENQPNVEEQKKPDDVSGIYVQGHVRIFDPETKEIYLNGRA